MILSLCLSMICAQTPCVCRVENRLPLFRIMLYEAIAAMKQNSETTVNLTYSSR